MADTPVSLLDRLRDQPDAGAWRQLVDLYTPLLQRWLGRYTIQPQDADDILQEVLGTVARELPQFRHNQRAGAFRHWLRAVLVHRLRAFWRTRDHQPAALGGERLAAELDALEDPASGLSRLWDDEHDRHVVRRLLAAVRGEFQASTWQAFEAVMLAGESPAGAAAILLMMITTLFGGQAH